MRLGGQHSINKARPPSRCYGLFMIKHGFIEQCVLKSSFITTIEMISMEEPQAGEGASDHVQYRPLKSLDVPVERFFESLRFEQREKLDQVDIQFGKLDEE